MKYEKGMLMIDALLALMVALILVAVVSNFVRVYQRYLEIVNSGAKVDGGEESGLDFD